MGERTRIEWTDATWNPWAGCTKVSPGCDHCYAETITHRWGRDFSTLHRASPQTFNAPLHWGKPRLIFTCSMSDFFHRQADIWRADAWAVMQATPEHTYQVLTKRPGLAVAWYKTHGWLPNVWLGVSVESQKYAPRIDVLARVPARVRFVSAEPLIGSLDLELYLTDENVSWVIVGGESGPGTRPMDLDWVRELRDRCQRSEVPFFFKQMMVGYKKVGTPLLDGRRWVDMPEIKTMDVRTINNVVR